MLAADLLADDLLADDLLADDLLAGARGAAAAAFEPAEADFVALEAFVEADVDDAASAVLVFLDALVDVEPALRVSAAELAADPAKP